MKEIKTIGDLKDAGLLNGLYSCLFTFYKKEVARCPYNEPFSKGTYPKTQKKLENEFLKENVSVLKDMREIVHYMGFGRGKKYKQLKIIFDNLGYELEN